MPRPRSPRALTPCLANPSQRPPSRPPPPAQPPGVTNSSSIISIYQSAIPKAKQVGATGPLANAFASALYEVVGVKGAPPGFFMCIRTSSGSAQE
jgi:hypothetical protein